MVHAASMAASASRIEISRARLMAAIDDYAAAVRTAAGSSLGEGLIHTREARDRLEAVFAEGLRRFDQSGEYAADGAIDLVAWLRSRCKLSGNAAAERVGIARQLEHLPQTEKAFATGELGYQHVAVLARTAEHVGAGARCARRRPAYWPWPTRWIPDSSPGWPRTSSTGSTPRRLWPRPIGHISDAT